MTGNHFDADEILQQVLLVMYEKLHQFKFESSLGTWIYRITTTRSLNLIKRRKIKQFFSMDDDAARKLKTNDNVEQDIENREEVEQVDAALQKLPEKQREVFILRHFEELTYEEISKITGKSVGGLKANYYHALAKITKIMKSEMEYGKENLSVSG